MEKSKNKKRREIRILDPSDKVWNAVVKQSETNKRTNGKQAEFMLETYIDQQTSKKEA